MSAPGIVSVARLYPYRLLATSYCRSNKPIRRTPARSNAPQGMNWSPASGRAAGADQVRPRSNDWLTMTSEFVIAAYGLVGAGVGLFRMSDQTMARCAASVGSAVMLPAAQLRNKLLWYVCRPKASG